MERAFYGFTSQPMQRDRCVLGKIGVAPTDCFLKQG
jgi:hypothetical protein